MHAIVWCFPVTDLSPLCGARASDRLPELADSDQFRAFFHVGLILLIGSHVNMAFFEVSPVGKLRRLRLYMLTSMVVEN